MLSGSFIRKKEITQQIQIKIYLTLPVPVSLLRHGSEFLVLTKKLSAVQVIQMKYLRNVMGVTKIDTIKSKIIRQRLNVELINENTEQSKLLRRFGHNNRINKKCQVRRICEQQKHNLDLGRRAENNLKYDRMAQVCVYK